MNAEEALALCQAYLDGELDPATVARVEACLAQNPEVAEAFAREREFHSFLKARSAQVDAPPNLAAGIKARLASAQIRNSTLGPSRVFAPAPVRSFRGGGWLLAVAGVVLAAAVIWAAAKSFQTPAPGVTGIPQIANETTKPQPSTAQVSTELATQPSNATQPKPPKPKVECPYMVACASEGDSVASGKTPLELQTEDRSKMSAFLAEKLKVNITAVPALAEHKLTPSGAGIATFTSLKKYEAPDAAFVVYKGAEKGSVTLLIHPWADEEPMASNIVFVKGEKYWVATHGENSVATWKSDGGKLVLSVVSTRSKDENFKIAQEARREFQAQAAMLKQTASFELAER